ncbi:aspartic peptidase domain-containing protein [Aspergillus cavernicola]|uniref:Aspartic peptidase domain-containing protein n=1 Tax=Aspergillus cavernicola TaxID=176166 RepID=A0ABR4IUK3_9EURO
MLSLKELVLAGLLVGSVTATTLPLNRRSTNATAPLVSTSYGTVFDVEVIIGGQIFQLLVDSGSSDTYVVTSDFQCIDQDSGLQQPQEDCLYDVKKTYNISDTYEKIPNQIFGIQYGNGIASGVIAFEEVTVAGVTVPKQRVGIADKSTPMGDGVNCGLLGLGYPALTSAHPANITDNTTYWYNRIPYNPILFTMYDQGLIQDSYFAHALARSPINDSSAFGGYLSLGELPPVKHEDNWAVAPVELMNNIPLNFTSFKKTRSYWALTVPSTSWGKNGSNAIPFQAFLDTGNPLSYIPGRIADPFNKLFNPPAVYNKDLAAYIVDCNAKPPSLGLEIGGTIFEHNPSDLIYQTGEDLCISAIGNSDEIKIGGTLQLNIIGVPFLKSVVSVFDFGRNEMRFARLLEEVTAGRGNSSTGNSTGNDNDGQGGDEYVPGNIGGKVVPGAMYVLSGVVGGVLAYAFAV